MDTIERLRGWDDESRKNSSATEREAADEIERLRELANHLRHCRECGETDVTNCAEGRELWEACMTPRQLQRLPNGDLTGCSAKE